MLRRQKECIVEKTRIYHHVSKCVRNCHCSYVAWKFSDIPRYISNKTWLHLISTEPEQNTKRSVTAYLISPDVADIRLMQWKRKKAAPMFLEQPFSVTPTGFKPVTF